MQTGWPNQTHPTVQMGNVDLAQKNEVKYRACISIEDRHGWSTSQPKSETNALVTRKKINTINRKQTPIESRTQTHTDIWNSAMEDSLQFQQRNLPALSMQDSLIHFERTLVHTQPQDPW
jgi:hypothetical protein